jgi:hypothetical protein
MKSKLPPMPMISRIVVQMFHSPADSNTISGIDARQLNNGSKRVVDYGLDGNFRVYSILLLFNGLSTKVEIRANHDVTRIVV